MNYGITKETSLSFDEAIAKVTEELKKEGFGVLTTIDVQETLKKKIQVEIERYTILGACNPPFAHQALQADNFVGLLLPCNVIVFENAGKTTISAFDPNLIERVTENQKMASLAAEVRTKLERVIANC